jgi:hypothetical protein
VAKQTGITGTVTIGDANGVSQTFSGNVQTFDIQQSRAQIDVTGIDKSFMERLPGLGDYSINLAGVYDGAGTATAIQTFASMGTALRAFTIVVGPVGTAVGTAALASFNVARGGDGALNWTASLNCANGTAMAWT